MTKKFDAVPQDGGFTTQAGASVILAGAVASMGMSFPAHVYLWREGSDSVNDDNSQYTTLQAAYNAGYDDGKRIASEAYILASDSVSTTSAIMGGSIIFVGKLYANRQKQTYMRENAKTEEQYKDDLFQQGQQNTLLDNIVSKVQEIISKDAKTETFLPGLRAVRARAVSTLVRDYIVESNFDLLKLQQLEGNPLNTFATNLAGIITANTERSTNASSPLVTLPTKETFTAACDTQLPATMLEYRRRNVVVNNPLLLNGGQQPMQIEGNAANDPAAPGWGQSILAQLCNRGAAGFHRV